MSELHLWQSRPEHPMHQLPLLSPRDRSCPATQFDRRQGRASWSLLWRIWEEMSYPLTDYKILSLKKLMPCSKFESKQRKKDSEIILSIP